MICIVSLAISTGFDTSIDYPTPDAPGLQLGIDPTSLFTNTTQGSVPTQIAIKSGSRPGIEYFCEKDGLTGEGRLVIKVGSVGGQLPYFHNQYTIPQIANQTAVFDQVVAIKDMVDENAQAGMTSLFTEPQRCCD